MNKKSIITALLVLSLRNIPHAGKGERDGAPIR